MRRQITALKFLSIVGPYFTDDDTRARTGIAWVGGRPLSRYRLAMLYQLSLGPEVRGILVDTRSLPKGMPREEMLDVIVDEVWEGSDLYFVDADWAVGVHPNPEQILWRGIDAASLGDKATKFEPPTPGAGPGAQWFIGWPDSP